MRKISFLFILLFFSLVPQVHADPSCEGRFVNPITDVCWRCIFPLSLGSVQVGKGDLPDTSNPGSPLQLCPAPPPLFVRPGLAIGYWEPMAMTDVSRSPGCMVNLGGFSINLGKTGMGTARKDDKQVNGAFYHVHWYKYPLTYWLNIITSAGCLEGGDMDIAYLSEIDPTWVDSSLTTILNPEAILFANPIAQGACAADALASAFICHWMCSSGVVEVTAHFTRLTARSVMSPARCSRRYWSVSVWPSSSTGRDKLWRVSGRTRQSVTNIPPRSSRKSAGAIRW